jgi:hypothetical protein
MPRLVRARRTVMRVWPLAVEAWRRWDRLPPHEKERHKERIRQVAKQAGERVRRGR